MLKGGNKNAPEHRKTATNDSGMARPWFITRITMISEILDIHPEVYDKALENITQGKRTDRGARGMSGEQAVRCGILLRMPRPYRYPLINYVILPLPMKIFARKATVSMWRYHKTPETRTCRVDYDSISVHTFPGYNPKRPVVQHKLRNRLSMPDKGWNSTWFSGEGGFIPYSPYKA